MTPETEKEVLDVELADFLGKSDSPERIQVKPNQLVPIGNTSPSMFGGIEGADKIRKSMARWNPPITSPDEQIIAHKNTIDGRSVNLFTNDAYVRSGINMHRDGIVGAIYRLNCKPRYKMLGLDEKWAMEFAEEVEERFTSYAESNNNWVDASRHQNFSGLVRIQVMTYLMFGECLATSEWMRNERLPYRTAFQLISPERLCDPKDRSVQDRRVKGGVRLSASGAPIGYYIRRPKLSTFYDWAGMDAWVYIKAHTPIGRPVVIHIVDQSRPGQTRGISELVAALKELHILRTFRDVVLQSAAVQAMFAATVESELPKWEIFEALGSGDDAAANALSFAEKWMNGLVDYQQNATNLKVDGGKIPILMPGTQLKVMPFANSNSGIGEGFEQALIRYLAASLGVSYEELSRDYSKTNYSSARAGMLKTWQAMQVKKRACADRFASAVYRNWFEEAVNKGEITTMNSQRAPNMYEGLNMEAYTNCNWIGAGRGQIDELKETQAADLRVTRRLSTREAEIARIHGSDWREVFNQIAREEEAAEELGIQPVAEQQMERQLDIQEDSNNDQENDSPV